VKSPWDEGRRSSRKRASGSVRADGKEMRAVNVRCLDGVALEGLKLYPYDGKSL
jgi:hypothetical protein